MESLDVASASVMRPTRKAASKAALAIRTEAQDNGLDESGTGRTLKTGGKRLSKKGNNNDDDDNGDFNNAFSEIMSNRSRTIRTTTTSTAATSRKQKRATTSTVAAMAPSALSGKDWDLQLSNSIPEIEDLILDAAKVRQDGGRHSWSYHHFMTHKTQQQVHDHILAWYDVHHRQLPWRRDFLTPSKKPLSSSPLPSQKTLSDTVDEAAALEAMTMQEYESAHPGQRAYEVWVSEIMCQQTQVATVIPYYNTWMTQWPTIRDLAAANLEDVNKVWTGLGYYSRASRLHAGAQKVVKEFDGILPSDPAVLEKEVPGIGRYTAGAIVSHAYNVPAELVDGNVIRVLSRLRAIGGDVKNPKVVDLHWQIAKELVHQSRPGCFNQGLMELGAMVCTPQNPRCSECPVRTSCRAYTESLELKRSRKEAMGAPQKRTMKDDDEEEDNGDMCTLCLPETEVEGKDQGLVTQYPRKAVKKAPRDEECAVSILERVRDDGDSGGSISEFLLVKRPEKGLLAGMWEFPTVEQDQLQRDHFADTKHNNNTHKKQTQRSTTTNPAIASSESIPLPLTTYKQRAESSLQYLTNTLGQDWILKDSNAKDIQRRDLGNVQHLFSHIRKVYHVEWILIHVSGNEKVVQKDNTLATAKRKGGNGPEIQWLTAKELATAAIPTGINKTYQLLQKHKAGEFTQEHTAAGASGNGRGNKRKKMERVSDSSKDKKVKKKEGHSDISKFFKAPAK